jgi:thiol-disulfide isomerase/thioredoxin
VDDLAGQVFLVNFLTCSCVNCIRTFPHLDDRYNSYNDLGFTIIGVHSPEFDFEKERMNVEAAVEKYGIDYPVILDNDFKIWREYQGRDGGYWPAHFLLYPLGRIFAIL